MSEHTSIDAPNAADAQTATAAQQTLTEYLNALKAIRAIAATQQVKDYLNTYGIVLVTNLRQFLIVEHGATADPVERESFTLADDEQDCWQQKAALVQTVFYGVFSVWVRWHKDNPGPKAKFDWRTAEWSLHVPFIRTRPEAHNRSMSEYVPSGPASRLASA